MYNLSMTQADNRKEGYFCFSLITFFFGTIALLGSLIIALVASSGGLVGLGVPLLHDGEVEVLVGEEGGADDHGETDGEDRPHQTAVDDRVYAFALPAFHLLLPVLFIVLKLNWK